MDRKYGTVEKVSNQVETIFMDENYLVYSGKHEIYSGKDEIGKKARGEPVFPFLFNKKSKEIHDLNNEQPGCGLSIMKKDNMKFIRTVDEMEGYDYCAYCFGRGLSMR